MGLPPVFLPSNEGLNQSLQLNQNALLARHRMQQENAFAPGQLELQNQQVQGGQMALQEQQDNLRKRQELEQTIKSNPDNPERAAFDWTKTNDLPAHMKLVAHYSKQLFETTLEGDPDRAAVDFERATGEKVKAASNRIDIPVLNEDGTTTVHTFLKDIRGNKFTAVNPQRDPNEGKTVSYDGKVYMWNPKDKDYTTLKGPVTPKEDLSPDNFQHWKADHPTGTYEQFLDSTEKIKSRYSKASATSAGGAGAGTSDAADIAQAIIDGKQSPEMTRMYGKSVPIRGILARKGYDLARAEQDWKAISKHLATLNGQQQERLRQAITFTDETLPQVEAAYAEWKKQAGVSGIKILNKANLMAMKQLPGAAGSAATNLDALIADFTSELGTVYKGGNSSTDESLKLAAQNLSSDWNDQTFSDAIKRLRTSVKIRKNSIMTSEAVGVSPDSPYQPKTGGGGAAGGSVKMKAPDGSVRLVPADAVPKYKAKGAVVVNE